MSAHTDRGHFDDADRSTEAVREAFEERERADAELRRAIASLLAQADSAELRSSLNVALIRARVSRIKYAAVLSAAGCVVPDHLVDDVPGH
jgi:hypothetical protein